jgi:hypothetical protein
LTSPAAELRDLRLPLEARLLLACARTNLTPQREAQIRALSTTPLDWDYVLRLAERHHLAPLLRRNLHTAPATVLERLKLRFRQNVIHSMRLTAELVALLKLFQSAGVDVIPFKGPLLAQAAYGDIALREYVDLDLLVRPRDVPRAQRLMTQRGYQPNVDLDGPQFHIALRSVEEQEFTRPNGPMVEVHWSLLPPRMPALPAFDDLWQRAAPVNLSGYVARTLGDEDLLLFLIVHGGKHFWSSLGWLCDVAQVIAHRPQLDWHRLAEHAAAHRYTRMLRLGATLAAELFDAPVPPDLATETAAARQIVERAFSEHAPERGMWAAGLAHTKLLDTTAGKARYWGSLLPTPTLREWVALPLPRPLFFLYYPLRPLRLFAKYVLRRS